jgi:hypothetical protein
MATTKKPKSLSLSDSLTEISVALSQQLPKKEKKVKGKFFSDAFTGLPDPLGECDRQLTELYS